MKIVVLIGSIVGMVFLFSALLVQSAQQQAALAGLACASAIVPYVLFRLQSVAEEQHQLARIVELLRQGNAQGRRGGGIRAADAGDDGQAPCRGEAGRAGSLDGGVAPPS